MRASALLIFVFVAFASSAGAQAPERSFEAPAAQALTLSVQGSAAWAPHGPRLQIDPHGYERKRLLNARPSLFFPIATIATGVGVAVGPWVTALVAYLVSVGAGSEDAGSASWDVYRPLLGFSVVGAAVATGGALWLRSNIKERQRCSRLIRQLDLAQGPALLRW